MGRRKRTEVRREEIALAVLQLIAAEGHEALNMVTVAKRIGVVPSALYRHFPSKDDMIIAALQLHRDERMDELDRLLDQHQAVLPAYTEFIGRLPCFAGQTAALPRIAFGILPTASGKLRTEAQAIFDGFIGKMASDMQRAQQRGEVDSAVNCRTAALAIWGVFVTAAVRSNLFGDGFDLSSHLQHGWEFFLRAVRLPAPPPVITPRRAQAHPKEVRR
jgi:AcrR family transcriptional regulator